MNYIESIIEKFEKENDELILVNDGEDFYIHVDFEKVKGYEKLSVPAKKLFERVYRKHNSACGLEAKKSFIPVKVIGHKQYLEVYFKNKEWLHYTSSGEWY